MDAMTIAQSHILGYICGCLFENGKKEIWKASIERESAKFGEVWSPSPAFMERRKMSIVLASDLISRIGITSVTDAEKASKTKIQKI